jgi:hypothetical protein
MKKVTRFLWWCAGARTEILEECITDQAKYFGIGGTILFTALMAAFAGGYAFFTAFNSIALSIPFGVFWGLLIFNLDRYIVATIGKGDGTSKITLDEWINAAPRLIMAILLGFVISTPLELKLFGKEINVEIENIIREERGKLGEGETPILNLIANKQEKINELKKEAISAETKADNLPNVISIEDKQIDLVNTEIKRLDAVIESNSTNWKKYDEEMKSAFADEEKEEAKKNRDKFDNRNNNKLKRNLITQITNLNNAKFKRGTDYYATASKLNNTNQPKILVLEQEIKILEDKLTGVREGNDEMAKQYSGLMARLEALSRLTEKYTVLFVVKWLITFLFVFIEVAPVLFKLMAEAGPYDDIIDRIKHEYNVTEKQKISDLNDKINTDIVISTEKNKGRLDAELKGNKELLDSIAMSQAEIAKKAVEKWKENELKKLEKSTSHIIQSNTKTNGLAFEDKFWSDKSNSEETIYVFKNGSINELWVKLNSQILIGKWMKINNNQIEIEINSGKKLYNIVELNDTKFHLNESTSNLDLILNLV